MGEVSTIGLDIAKSVFQVHGVDADGTVVIRKRISRAKVLEFFAAVPPCLVGVEACPSAHHWSRKLQVFGHTVKLMPPSYVKAYLKRGIEIPQCSSSLPRRPDMMPRREPEGG
jgi:transposase